MGRYLYGFAINRDPVRPLASCVRDLHALRYVLERRFGFTVEEFTDEEVTDKAVRSTFKRIRSQRTAGDDVIVFFSGHGAEKAAWCVFDAAKDGETAYIERDEIHELSSKATVRHLLVVSDSCFALGQAHKGAEPAHAAQLVDELERNPSRMFLTATGNYPAWDGGSNLSPFVDALVGTLEHLDAPAGISDLFPRIRAACHGANDPVAQKQVPYLRTLDPRLHGEFVFRPRTAASAVSPPTGPPSIPPPPAVAPVPPEVTPEPTQKEARVLLRAEASESVYRRVLRALLVDHLRELCPLVGVDPEGLRRAELDGALLAHEGDLVALVTSLAPEALERVAGTLAIDHARMADWPEVEVAVVVALAEDDSGTWADADDERCEVFLALVKKPELRRIFRALGDGWDDTQPVDALRDELYAEYTGQVGWLVRLLSFETLYRIASEVGLPHQRRTRAALERSMMRWLAG